VKALPPKGTEQSAGLPFIIGARLF